jgi:arylsulfatase A-like enzyme
MADDMGQGDPQVYNDSSNIPTPHIDRLAEAGMRFTDAHTPSSVCTPTRYGLLTGRYAWRTRLMSGVLWGYSPALIDTQRTTIASLLKRQGYTTAAVGKWHLGLGAQDSTDYSEPLRPSPVDYGFDMFFGIPASLDMDPYVYIEDDRVVQEPTARVPRSEHRREGGGGFWRAGPAAPGFAHIDVLSRTTDRAVSFINEQTDDGVDQPFFLYLPFSAPHTPWLPTDAYRDTSGAGYYGDFTAQVDGAVGRVLNALEDAGFAENTLAIFTSDNGAHWPEADIEQWGHDANNGWRGQKADIWEGGHRVPFVVRWPGRVPPGTVSDETICLTDVMATLAAVVGVDLARDEGVDSYNVLPAMLGQSYNGPIREATVHHALDGMFALRQGPWKLILGRGSGGFTAPQRRDVEAGAPPGQLYHLDRDPKETNNLYSEHPDVVDRLSGLLDTYREQGHSRPLRPAASND